MNHPPAANPRRARIHQAARAEILDHARQQIAQVGAPALSLRAIARALQVTAPALYRYFASRDDLVTALIADAYRSLGDALAVAAPDEITIPAAESGMRVLIETLADALNADALNLPAVFAKPAPAIRAQLAAWKKSYALSVPLPALHLALICWSRLHGLVSLELINQLPAFLGDVTELYRAEVVALLAQMGLSATRVEKRKR
ncbi:MAG: TetR/AcrR family transcriptional regulator [Chloroflexi bacterium]|nr:TetR/AcrR family transcriptional regulator [Chloroflexota bacterium]